MSSLGGRSLASVSPWGGEGTATHRLHYVVQNQRIVNPRLRQYFPLNTSVVKKQSQRPLSLSFEFFDALPLPLLSRKNNQLLKMIINSYGSYFKIDMSEHEFLLLYYLRLR